MSLSSRLKIANSSSVLKTAGLQLDAFGKDQNIRVAVRLRPFNDREKGDSMVVIVDPLRAIITMKSDQSSEPRSFAFDHVYDSSVPSNDLTYARQCDVYNNIGVRVLESVLNGYNGCIFAYGQTGSGKTYTMMGFDEEEQGIIPRLLDDLFANISRIKEANNRRSNATRSGKTASSSTRVNNDSNFIRVWVSYVEVYNEHLTDLIGTHDKSGVSSDYLQVYEHPKLGVYVKDLTEIPVSSRSEMERLLDYGTKRRVTKATAMNTASSRSHSVFTIKLQIGSDSHATLTSRLNLVDLAGSERTSKTMSGGAIFKEGNYINQSLSALGMVIRQLADASKISHEAGKKNRISSNFIAYRSSKLTFLLKDSLGGNSLTTMIATLSPSSANYEESMSSLRFANSVKSIKVKPKKNIDKKDELINLLKKEIEQLRANLGKETKTVGSSAYKGSVNNWKDQVLQKQQLLDNLQISYDDQLKKAGELHKLREDALSQIGLTYNVIDAAFGIEPNTPYLLNISPDPAFSGSLLYFLLCDSSYIIGSSNQSDKNVIKIPGLNLPAEFCTINNSKNQNLTLKFLGNDSVVSLTLNGKELNSRLLANYTTKNSQSKSFSSSQKMPHDMNSTNHSYVIHDQDRIVIDHSMVLRVVFPEDTFDDESLQTGPKSKVSVRSAHLRSSNKYDKNKMLSTRSIARVVADISYQACINESKKFSNRSSLNVDITPLSSAKESNLAFETDLNEMRVKKVFDNDLSYDNFREALQLINEEVNTINNLLDETYNKLREFGSSLKRCRFKILIVTKGDNVKFLGNSAENLILVQFLKSYDRPLSNLEKLADVLDNDDVEVISKNENKSKFKNKSELSYFIAEVMTHSSFLSKCELIKQWVTYLNEKNSNLSSIYASLCLPMYERVSNTVQKLISSQEFASHTSIIKTAELINPFSNDDSLEIDHETLTTIINTLVASLWAVNAKFHTKLKKSSTINLSPSTTGNINLSNRIASFVEARASYAKSNRQSASKYIRVSGKNNYQNKEIHYTNSEYSIESQQDDIHEENLSISFNDSLKKRNSQHAMISINRQSGCSIDETKSDGDTQKNERTLSLPRNSSKIADFPPLSAEIPTVSKFVSDIKDFPQFHGRPSSDTNNFRQADYQRNDELFKSIETPWTAYVDEIPVMTRSKTTSVLSAPTKTSRAVSMSRCVVTPSLCKPTSGCGVIFSSTFSTISSTSIYPQLNCLFPSTSNLTRSVSSRVTEYPAVYFNPPCSYCFDSP